MNLTKKELARNLVMIVIGSAVFSLGFDLFLDPNGISCGGVSGIAMLIVYGADVPWLTVGLLSAAINIPLFFFGYRQIGKYFFFGSMLGMVISSVCFDLFAAVLPVPTVEPLVASIFGGVMAGVGLGIVFLAGASTGGVDIVAKFLRRQNPHINFGTLILIIDAVIVAAYAVILNKYESAMYSVIAMFVVSKVIDLVLYGIDNSCICYIISEKSQELIDDIISGHMHRGVTILNGEGAYSHQQKQVIMCVIKRTQIAELRKLVRIVDERAFFIVTDAKNVFGNGFENISEVK